MTEKPRRLGRGLEALIAGANAPAPATASGNPASIDHAGPAGPLHDVPIQDIKPNPFQPRRVFKPEELADLENSLRASGLLQPITVRQMADASYELVAGERRLRAASRLGWERIPALVKPLDDRDMLVLALVENLQRANLNPIDEAQGLQRLIDEFGFTQQEVASAVGKERPTVANLLRILTLPEGIQRLVRDEQLSLGHARALLAMPNERVMLDAARRAVETGMSVREMERLTQAHRSEARPKRPATTTPQTAAPHTPIIRQLTDQLRRRLQTDVSIDIQPDARGKVSIAFYSMDDLQRLAELLVGPTYDQ